MTDSAMDAVDIGDQSFSVRDLLPQAGAMVLLDRVLEVGEWHTIRDTIESAGASEWIWGFY
jgi:predicted hotdog family 3-hydroxylacyl-ACP dehydratase